MIYAIWHGGHNYSPSSVHNPEDIETYDSVMDAIAECRDRYNNVTGQFPCVDEDSGMSVFIEKPGIDNEYPDYLIVCTGVTSSGTPVFKRMGV